jgi:hypothetical protein
MQFFITTLACLGFVTISEAAPAFTGLPAIVQPENISSYACYQAAGGQDFSGHQVGFTSWIAAISNIPDVFANGTHTTGSGDIPILFAASSALGYPFTAEDVQTLALGIYQTCVKGGSVNMVAEDVTNCKSFGRLPVGVAYRTPDTLSANARLVMCM